MASAGARLHQRIKVRGSEGLCPSGADDIFLIQRLNIYEEYYHIILKFLDYMSNG